MKRYWLIFPAAFFTCCVLLALHAVSFSAAEPTRVIASLDTNTIRIGEQIKLQFTVNTSSDKRISFPVLPDTMNGLEIVSRSAIDTIRSEDGQQLTLKQQLSITAFDSGYYVVQPFIFLVSSKTGSVDSLSTEAQLISVKTIPVDTTKAIKTIKPIMEPPFDWRELLPWFYFIIVLTVIGGAVYYYLLKRKNRVVEPEVRKAPDRPAHEIALEALAQLEGEKLWQQGAFKVYHIRLSDILRTYLEHRFLVAALESTTDETLQGLRRHSLDALSLSKLESVLRLADMVKFAKAIPIVTENEQSLSDARAFIRGTALTDKGKEDGK